MQPKVAVCSKYDRQTDTRGFAERRNMFKPTAKPNEEAEAKDDTEEKVEE